MLRRLRLVGPGQVALTVGVGLALAAVITLFVTGTDARVGPANAASTGPGGRYYIVKAAENGQREYLFQIAVATLGNGNRYREIFELNRDREQPDGGRLTDPMELRPGWVLLLPKDATGPGVTLAPPVRPSLSGSTLILGFLPRYAVAAIGVVLALLLLAMLRRVSHRLETVRAGPSEDAPAGEVPDPAQQPTVELDLGPPVERGRPGGQWPGQVQVEILDDAGTTWSVRLVSARPPSGPRLAAGPDGHQAPFGRLGAAERLPAATMPVDLGLHGALRWCVDLARAPDLLTIDGPLAQCQRLAAGIAIQVRRGDAEVVVVADVLGGYTPADTLAMTSFPDLDHIGAGPRLIISPGLGRTQLRQLHHHVSRTQRQQLAVIVVGPAMRARWSVTAA
jgi:hypothetical protein